MTITTVKHALNGAIPIVNPLDELVEKTKADLGVPFHPDILKALSELQQEDLPQFIKLRKELQKVGCPVSELTQQLKRLNEEGDAPHPKQAEMLIELALGSCELFHTKDRISFADMEIENHRETWSIDSQEFLYWLEGSFYRKTGNAANAEALKSAISNLKARAIHGDSEHDVYIRVAELDGKYYLDLCDVQWRAVELDEDGWRVIDCPPVRFCRSQGMLALPEPIHGTSIDILRSFLNISSDHDFVLVVCWLLTALVRRGSYPVLVISGEQGTAKSTFSRMIRKLVDPHCVPLRSTPRTEHDLFIAAFNTHVLAFDNISTLSQWCSDSLCQLATGGGYSKRRLYTNTEEVLINVIRPIILNGIDDFVTRSDLADRAIFINLEPISVQNRQIEEKLWTHYDHQLPGILGALLDAIVVGMKKQPKLIQAPPKELPRMADFALWSQACETAFWPASTFEEAYNANRHECATKTIDDDPVANAIRTWMEKQTMPTIQTMTCTELLSVLKKESVSLSCEQKDWPASPQMLSRQLKRIAPLLRAIGIKITFFRHGKPSTRLVKIEMIPSKHENPSSASSASSADILRDHIK